MQYPEQKRSTGEKRQETCTTQRDLEKKERWLEEGAATSPPKFVARPYALHSYSVAVVAEEPFFLEAQGSVLQKRIM